MSQPFFAEWLFACLEAGRLPCGITRDGRTPAKTTWGRIDDHYRIMSVDLRWHPGGAVTDGRSPSWMDRRYGPA